MDGMKQVFDTAISAKRKRRSVLAALPIEEKMRILLTLQRMTAPLLRARGRNVRVWSMPESEG
jgi:hypothetical protein